MTLHQAGAIEASWKADGGEAKTVLLSWAGGSCASHEDIEVSDWYRVQ
jgi:hypothetical protein